MVTYYSWAYIGTLIYNFTENALSLLLSSTTKWVNDISDTLILDRDVYNLDSDTNRLRKFKLKLEYKSFLKSPFLNLTNSKPNSLALQASDLFSNPLEVNVINFRSYNNESNLESLDNGYENIKNFKYLYHFNNKSTQFNSSSFFAPVSYTTVLDYFRADFDEHNWSLNNNPIGSASSHYYMPGGDKHYALTNSMKLRTTAKNSIVTYNAIQKVYKSRFDDSRSNTNFGDFTNSNSKYPFLIESKSPYESMLGKNKESYFNVSLYNKEFSNNQSVFSDS